MKELIFKELNSSRHFSTRHIDFLSLLLDSSYTKEDKELQDARSYIYILLNLKPIEVLIVSYLIEKQDIFYSKSNSLNSKSISNPISSISILNAIFLIHNQKLSSEYIRLVMLEGLTLSKELEIYGYRVKIPSISNWNGGTFYRVMSDLGIDYEGKSKIDSLDFILRRLEYEEKIINNALVIYERFRKYR
jgi:hypothetical protein